MKKNHRFYPENKMGPGFKPWDETWVNKPVMFCSDCSDHVYGAGCHAAGMFMSAHFNSKKCACCEDPM